MIPVNVALILAWTSSLFTFLLMRFGYNYQKYFPAKLAVVLVILVYMLLVTIAAEEYR